jgi:hypothetical protein
MAPCFHQLSGNTSTMQTMVRLRGESRHDDEVAKGN